MLVYSFSQYIVHINGWGEGIALSSLATIQNHRQQDIIANLGRLSVQPREIGRRKLLIGSMAVILLVLALVLALGRSSHAILGGAAAGTVPGSAGASNSSSDGGAQTPGVAASSSSNSADEDTISTDSSSLNVNLNSSSTTSSNPASSSSGASMTVNGQSVPIKNPGSIHKIIKNSGKNGNTEVNISVQNNSSGTAM